MHRQFLIGENFNDANERGKKLKEKEIRAIKNDTEAKQAVSFDDRVRCLLQERMYGQCHFAKHNWKGQRAIKFN